MAEQTGINLTIPFTNPLQHMYDPIHMKVADNLGGLNELYPSGELFYFNFDVDGGTVSKRGDREIEFFGTDNNGVIEDSLLKLAGLGKSSARVMGVSLPVPNELSGKISIIGKTTGFSGTHEFGSIKNTVDSSAIKFFLQWQGSGIYRVIFQLLDATGVVKYNSILGTIHATGDDPFHITYSLKRGNKLYLYFNGSHYNTVDISTWNVNFSQVDVYYGYSTGTSNCLVDFNYSQLINADYYYSEGDTSVDQPFSYDQTFQELITVAPILMDKFLRFYPNYNFIDKGEIRHRIMIGAAYWYYDVANDQWKPVTNPATDFNTKDEINDHCQELELNEGVGSVIQITTLVKSNNGFEAPYIVDLGIEYRMFFSFGQATPTCLIYGKIEDCFGQAVEGATISFIPDSGQFANSTQIGTGRDVLTESNGKFSQSYIQGMTGTFYVKYPALDSDGQTETISIAYDNITIPTEDSKEFKLVVDA